MPDGPFDDDVPPYGYARRPLTAPHPHQAARAQQAERPMPDRAQAPRNHRLQASPISDVRSDARRGPANHVAAPGVYSHDAFMAASQVQLRSLDQALVQFRQSVASRTRQPSHYLQLRDDGGLPAAADIHGIARTGIAAGAGSLPYLDQIQRSFGRHDVSDVQAHTGPHAQRATESLGAHAYAMGSNVVLGATGGDLHTVAHEAAHVVQQRAGVALSGGVGAAGDAYEQHADQVADAVVRGQSAEALLDRFASAGGGASGIQAQAVQFDRTYDGPGAYTKIDTLIAQQNVEAIRALDQAMEQATPPTAAEPAVVSFPVNGTRWTMTLAGVTRYNHTRGEVARAARALEATPEGGQQVTGSADEVLDEATEGAQGQSANRSSGGASTPFQVQRSIPFPQVTLMTVPHPSRFIDQFQLTFTSSLQIGDIYQPRADHAGRRRSEAEGHMASDAHVGVSPAVSEDGQRAGVGVTEDGAILAFAQEHWASLRDCPVADHIEADSNGGGNIGVQLSLEQFGFPGLSFSFTAASLSAEEGLQLGQFSGSQSIATPVLRMPVGNAVLPIRLQGAINANIDPNWTAIAAELTQDAVVSGEGAAVVAGASAAEVAGAVAVPVLAAVVIVGGTMWAMHQAAEEGRQSGLHRWYVNTYADRFSAVVFGENPTARMPTRHGGSEQRACVQGRNDAYPAFRRLSAAQAAQLRATYRTRRRLEEAVRAELCERFGISHLPR